MVSEKGGFKGLKGIVIRDVCGERVRVGVKESEVGDFGVVSDQEIKGLLEGGIEICIWRELSDLDSESRDMGNDERGRIFLMFDDGEFIWGFI